MASGPDADAAAALTRQAQAYTVLEAARWQAGPTSCPHCGAQGDCRLLPAPDGLSRPTRTGRPTARRLWRCGVCRRQFSVLTGTVLERTKVPLPVWLNAMRILSTSPGTCSRDLARSVGVSVETASAMLHLVLGGLSAADGGPVAQFQG